MTNTDILQKIIEKAVENGYTLPKFPDYNKETWEYSLDQGYKEYNAIIFSHDFLKAYYGEEDFIGNGVVFHNVPAWQYHAGELAKSTDRLAYLARSLSGDNKKEKGL